MGHVPPPLQKKLIRMIQRGEARIDLGAERVNSEWRVVSKWADEDTGNPIFFGYLPNKLVPFRKKLLEEIQERQAKEEREEQFEKTLEQGLEMTLDSFNRNLKIEDRFNIHPGHVYRVIVSGINPLDSKKFDGILESARIFADKEGFTPLKIELRDGLAGDGYSEKTPFTSWAYRRGDSRLLGFGSISDEEGFYKARERIRQGGK